jgi:hypothetical protein
MVIDRLAVSNHPLRVRKSSGCQVSSKFMNRLGKYASSMSRFLRGEDESDADGRQEPAADPLARAFAEIEEQKAAFFRTPSKARVSALSCVCAHLSSASR